MTIMYVETWIVKPDKLGEYTSYCKNCEELMKKQPDAPKELKSLKRFYQLFGGNWGGIVSMMEAESMEDLMKALQWLMANKEYLTKIYPEWAAIVVPGSDSISIWTSKL
jgi:hypothetical protein